MLIGVQPARRTSLERRCDTLRGLLQGIVGEMGVARGGLGFKTTVASIPRRELSFPPS